MDIYNPDYYRKGKIEVADFIEDKGFNFFLGNVVKYVSRAGMKEGNSVVQDLKKAQWYLNNPHWINRTEYGVTTYITDKDVECSECGHRQPRLFDMNFCPNCGADMQGEN